MLQRAARNAYSWWWASHIRTKQSKWLDQNLQDMEEKVEHILKIIEEDADSFAQRAEMYYRKRPELVNFVEDSFRGYRALAERYDHLSRELQTANRTIATVYPEQVELAMDDEDEENLPSSTSLGDSPKHLPVAPKLDIPKTKKNPQKNSKTPARLMSKKGLLKFNVPSCSANTNSGMSKDEALEKIDELQKAILELQTEKEFVQSLYENGLAKYWEIEERVIEMQSKVNSLQDEYGIGTVIEDDEARILMAATALKSCQEALIRLKEKQEQSDEEARLEYQRIKEAHKKMVILKGNLGNQTNGDDLHKELESNRQHDSILDNANKLESLREKNKEQAEANSGPSLIMSEMAEKIDDLVEKVISLETALTSQNALVKRLRSETNDLQAHVQSIEQDKETLIQGSDSKNDKVRELEQELLRIQNLNQNVKHQKRNLQIYFTEASFRIDRLSEKLKTVKQDEEVENIALIELRTDSVAYPVMELQTTEEVASSDNNSKISKLEPRAFYTDEEKFRQSSLRNQLVDLIYGGQIKAVSVGNTELEIEENEAVMSPGHDSEKLEDVRMEEAKKDEIAYRNTHIKTKDENLVQSNPSSPVDDCLVPSEGRVAPNSNPEIRFPDYKGMMSCGHDSVISKNVGMEGEVEKDNVPNQIEPIKAKSDFVQPDLNNCLDDLFLRGQPKSDPNDNLVEWLNEQKDMVPSGHDKAITEEEKMESEMSTSDSPYIHENGEKSFFNFNPFDCPKDHLFNGEVKNVVDPNSKGLKEHEDTRSPTNDLSVSKDVKTVKAEKYENQDLGDPIKAEEDNIVQFNPHKTFDYLSTNDQATTTQGVVPQCLNKEHAREMEPDNDTIFVSVGADESFVKTSLSNQLDGLFGDQVKVVPDARLAKSSKEHEGIAASNNDTLPPEHGKPEKHETRDDLSDQIMTVKAKEDENQIQSNPSNHLHYHPAEEQEPRKQKEDEKQEMPPKVDKDQNAESKEHKNEDDDQPDWKELFLNGLEGREKMLLQQYTAILRNYKETKKQLSDREKKTNDSLFKSESQIKELKNANALKDAEIQSLHRKLDLLQVCLDENPENNLTEFSNQSKQEIMTKKATTQIFTFVFPSTDQKQVPNLLQEQKSESLQRKEGSKAPERAVISPTKGEQSEKTEIFVEPGANATIEEKFRSDIDGLLEENIEFWMRFSTSFHQIPKFQTSIQDLQEELTKLRESKKRDGSSRHQSSNSEIRPIYNHLREIQTELMLWLEQNSFLKYDLQSRLSSLSSIHEEISRFSNADSKEEENPMSDYQAAKFQGEILNMKQENNQVAHKLQLGLEHVKGLQNEIARTISNLEEQLGISAGKNQRSSKNSSSRSKVPLRSFLFGVKLKKQKPSLFHCMTPALQKQYSDLHSVHT